MKEKKLTQRIICALLAVSVSLPLAYGAVSAIAKEKEIKNELSSQVAYEEQLESETDENDTREIGEKDETVYAILDANGKEKEKIVSGKIHGGEGTTTVNDVSNLKNINVIKGGTLKSQKKDDLVWEITDSDLFYQGDTNKKLPFEINIKYFLDGKEISPKKLAGKNGRLRIDVSVINKDEKKFKIGGKEQVISSPMIVAIGGMFDSDIFKNVSCDGGEVINDGKSNAVFAITMPGLKKSLNLDGSSIKELRDIDIREDFSISADVYDFELEPLFAMALSTFPEIETEDGRIDEMKDQMDKLKFMQDELLKIDPDHEIRDLFTVQEKKDKAKVLIDDIFKLYDFNRDALSIMPKYITDKNIKAIERLAKDVDPDALKKMEDDGVFEKLQAILKTVDGSINMNELKEVMGTLVKAKEALAPIANDVKNPNGKINALLAAIDKLSTDMEGMQTGLGEAYNQVNGILALVPGQQPLQTPTEGEILVSFVGSGIDGLFEPLISTIDNLIKVLSGQVVPPVTISEKLLDIPQDEAQDEQAEDKVDGVVTKPEETNPANPQDPQADKPVPPTEETTKPDAPQTGEETKPEAGEDKKDEEQKDPATPVETPQTEEKAPEKQEAEKQDNAPSEKIETKDEAVLGEEHYKKEMRAGNDELVAKLKGVKLALETKRDEAKQLLTKDLADLVKAKKTFESDQDLLAAVADITDPGFVAELSKCEEFYDKNSATIETLLKATESIDQRSIRQVSRLLRDLEDEFPRIKRQLINLQHDLEKENIKESFEQTPELINVLSSMNKHLDDSRDVADTLKKLFETETSNSFTSIINTLDELIAKGKVDEYSQNIDDLQELIERKDAIVELSKNTESFSGAREDVETTVRYIIKTEEIKKPEKKEEKAETPVVKEEKKPFFKRIFGK